MKYFSNKSMLASLLVSCIVVFYLLIFETFSALKFALIGIVILLNIILFTIIRYFSNLFIKIQTNFQKQESLANSLKALHFKLETQSELNLANDRRGRRILELSAESKDFQESHIKNARDLNIRLGQTLNKFWMNK